MRIFKRRSFLQNCLTIPVVGNLFGWHGLLSEVEAPDFGAVDFVRLVTSLEVTHKCKGLGIKPLSTLFADPLSKQFMGCKRSEKFGIGATFASHLELHNPDAALPGWRTHVYCRDDGSDYVVAVVRAPTDVFVRSLYATDSSGVIFRASVTPDYRLPAELKSLDELNLRLKPVSLLDASNAIRMVKGLSAKVGLSYMLMQGFHNCVPPAPSCRGNCFTSGQCYCYNCGATGCGFCCFPDCVSCILSSGGQICACC